jgi:hypothetical protein
MSGSAPTTVGKVSDMSGSLPTVVGALPVIKAGRSICLLNYPGKCS